MFEMDGDMEEVFLGEEQEDVLNDLVDSSVVSEDLELQIMEFSDKTNLVEVSFYLDTEFEQVDLETTIPICFQALVSFKVFSKTYKFLLLVYNENLVTDVVYKSSYRGYDLYTFSLNFFNESRNYYLLNFFLKVFFKEYDFLWDLQNKLVFKTYIYFYYSLKDLNISLGFKNMKDIYLGKKKSTFNQYNSVTGSFEVFIDTFDLNCLFRIQLKDLYGISNLGLQSLAEMYDIPFKKSLLLDNLKSNMTKALQIYFEEFQSYSLNDAIVLESILESYLLSSNNILKEVFFISDLEAYYKINTIPFTVGNLVFSFYKKFLDYKVFKNDNYLKLSIYSIGVLNPLSKTYSQNLEALSLLKRYKTLKDLKLCSPEDYKLLSVLITNNDVWKYLPWQFCSSKFFQEISINTTLLSMSYVSGGRITNERPTECYSEVGCDIDISSAYGSVLETLGLPLGKPKFIYYTPNQKKFLTLKDFFKKYPVENSFYKVMVEGDLTFSQDILFSRLISDNFLKKKLSNFDPSDPSSYSSKGHLLLLRQQLKDSTITAPLWNLLKKVSTSLELKELNNLKVTSAVYYDSKDQVFDIEELADIYLSNQKSERNLNDTLLEVETHKWFYMPFSQFISTLIEKRKVLKKANLNKPLQTTTKLIVNSFYGILCSPLFSINNVIVSDLVTSTIRARIWMMSKSLNLYVNITDGGFYSLDSITFLKSKKPGLDSFSNLQKSFEKNIVKKGSLGDKDWKSYFFNLDKIDNTDLKEKISVLSKNHMELFWEPYDLTIDFSIEVKEIYLKASYLFKAHYVFQIFDFENNVWNQTLYYKIRGYKINEYVEIQNPIYGLLVHILTNGFDSYNLNYDLYTGVYKTKKLIKYRSWKQNYTLDPSISYLPGDLIFEDHQFRLNNLHFPLNNYQEYKKRSQRGLRKLKENSLVKAYLFEKFLKSNTLSLMLKKMEGDNVK